MKKLSSILITTAILLSFSNTVWAEDSISVSIVQNAQSVDITAKYLKDGDCTGNISVVDDKQPHIYQKFSSLFFTTNGQSKTAPFAGLTKGAKYYVEASCSKASGEAYSQKDSFTFGVLPANAIVSISAVPTDKTVQVSVTYDNKVGPGVDNISGIITGNIVGMGGGMFTQLLTPSFNPNDGRVGATGKKTFTFNTISALTPETKYTIKITAQTGTTVKYTKSIDFTTKKLIPGNTPPTIPPTGGTGTGTQTGNNPVLIEPENITPSDSTTYNLLAPIGTLKQVQTANGIGSYLNILFKIIIGICGALAVIMIVIGGIQYMGNESVFGKTEAKSRILSAIIGLLIALGAYAILYTINPSLTGKDGISISQASIEVESQEIGILAEPDTGVTPAGCPDITTRAKYAPDSPEMYAWAQKCGRKLKMTLKSGQVIDVIPCDRSALETFNALGTTFKINKHLRGSINRIDQKWKTIKSSFVPSTGGGGGGMVCRFVNNPKVKKGAMLSFHSYGLAIDFNVKGNNFGNGKGNIPAEFVNVWKNEGWAWGGDWGDAMHFSKGERSNSKLVGE